MEGLPPGPLRDRVVALAAPRLSAVAADVVPATVRPFVRFTPTKRARLAAAPLAAALAADAVFRQAVAAGLAVPDDDAPLADRAAAAWLLRPDGWQELVDDAARALEEQAAAGAAAATVDAVARLTEQLEAVRAAGRAEAERLRTELGDLTRLDAAYAENGLNADENAYLSRRFGELDLRVRNTRR